MGKTIVQNRCPICNYLTYYLIRRNDKYRILYCKNCGLIFSSPLPSAMERKNFYSRFEFRKPKNKQSFAKQIKGINSDVKRIIKDVKKYKRISQRPTLLDCGGGTGFYAYAFSKNSFNVTLTDINQDACNYAKDKFPDCFKIINGDISFVSFNEKFDIIFVNQLIEHLVDINLFLKKVKGLLKKDGIIIFTTPNQRCKEFYFRPTWLYSYLRKTTNNLIPLRSFILFLKKPWICCDPPRHVYSFNGRNLSMILKRNGFDIIFIKTEYSTEQYYSERFYNSWKIGTLKDFGRIILNILAHLGVFFLKLVDKRKRWGNNLVILAKLSN